MHRTVSSEKYKKLIQWLQEARDEKKMPMRNMAALLGVSHSFIQKTEDCERRLDVYEYVQYCEALDVDPAEGLEKLAKSGLSKKS